MLLELFKKRKNDAKYVLRITTQKPCVERTIDLHLKNEAYSFEFICRHDNQSVTVLTYEVSPKTANTEFVRSILNISSVVMVSIHRKGHDTFNPILRLDTYN